MDSLLYQHIQSTKDNINDDSDIKSEISNKAINSNKRNSIKYILGIILGLALISSAFFIVDYKFDLFKSSKDIYSLDIKIKRAKNLIDFFREKKTIKTKVAYTTGEFNEAEQIINTDFITLITDSKFISDTILYNASTIILNSTVKMEKNETELNSFNIFDELVVKEFEKNPNGSKYPLGKFKFFKNGTITQIQLPKDMDLYNAQIIVELINNTVLKWTRSKKEDKDKGVNVKSKQNDDKNNVKVSEIYSTREYFDEYNNIEYKGSKFSKTIEREIKDEKIQNITINTNLNLQTQNKDKDVVNLGLDKYDLNIQSDISLIYEKEQKETINKIKNLGKKTRICQK